MNRILSINNFKNSWILAIKNSNYGNLRGFTKKLDGRDVVKIGDVSQVVKEPLKPELVPKDYLPENVSQSLLKHLRWIMQKDNLGQDVFLIGPPGPLKRRIAMMYLELTKKEVEYLSLSRDTTESDIKQRREISSGSAYYIDQSAVRAAKDGRVLIIEGVEKAERNVLPILNNLLENREMQLDDGRFLLKASHYDKLLESHSKEELDALKQVRVSEDFRVIALGLPVPKYQGNPLDPPFRSRFQARDIHHTHTLEEIEFLKENLSGASMDKLSQIISFANTIASDEASGLGLPDFPFDSIHRIAHILKYSPHIPVERLIDRLYPYSVMLGKEGITAVQDAMKALNINITKDDKFNSYVDEVRISGPTASVDIMDNRKKSEFKVACGDLDKTSSSQLFINTPYHDKFLSEMIVSHSIGDFCVIGPKGCGKSVLVNKFAEILGYDVQNIMLYQDMTSRDLLQHRMTLSNGDTAWQLSPLVKASIDGKLAVLDGVHRVNPGTFSILHRLIHDRELTLFDGNRLLPYEKYEELKKSMNLDHQEMQSRGIYSVHPSFRIIALAEPPVIGSSQQQWLNAELLNMFLYHNLRPLSQIEENDILRKLVPNVIDMKALIKLANTLRISSDFNLQSVSTSLSTRQLARIARRLAVYSDDDLYEIIQKACLSRFLPRLSRNALDEELERMNIIKKSNKLSVDGFEKAVSCEVKEGILRIGSTTMKINDPETKTKIPDVLFYENKLHLSVMEDMLKDYILGEHLLLVGNQGVGKNKIIDRFIYLLNRPREYIQLHRDTTVQTLTIQPTVRDGVIKYEDSPLVEAVKKGHILVIDEADKAPTNVTCILKALIESGEMHLSDGRRIVSSSSGLKPSKSVIVTHPDFRVFVLANRPGFPFLGNDFFGALGDIFSCHAIDNPDIESEISMLRQYAPDVSDEVLHKLVSAFSNLRLMADQGLISYPYSTREVVNMIKHIQMYPDESLSSVVRNVFDFDAYDKDLSETIVQTMHKHGIPVGADRKNISLAKQLQLPDFQLVGKMNIHRGIDSRRGRAFALPVEEKKLQIQDLGKFDVRTFPLDKTTTRSLLFTEQESFWSIPLHETSVVGDVAVSKGCDRHPTKSTGDLIHVAVLNPISLYTIDPLKQHLTCIDLNELFPVPRLGNYPKQRLKIATLPYPNDYQVIVYEENNEVLLSIDYETGQVVRLHNSSIMSRAADKLFDRLKASTISKSMCDDFSHEGILLFYKPQEQEVEVVKPSERESFVIDMPVVVKDVTMLSRNEWLITEFNTNSFYLLCDENNTEEYNIHPILMQDEKIFKNIQLSSKSSLSDSALSSALKEKISSPNRIFSTTNDFAMIAVGMPELSSVDVYGLPRASADESLNKIHEYLKRPARYSVKTRPSIVYLPDTGQIVRSIPPGLAPEESRPIDTINERLSAYLEITDPSHRMVRYIPIPGVTSLGHYSQWYGASKHDLYMAPMSNDGLVTIDAGGCMRLWEMSMMNISKSLDKWINLVGDGDSKPLQITHAKELEQQAQSPKHGKVDSTGAPHVGGNTWAGGTGGRDTAGLGGIGGPYRLDAGHDVYQVSDEIKEAVPDEVKKAARAMGQKAYQERLKAIKMDQYDADTYESYSGNVKRQVKSVRVILDSLQAKGKERAWLRNQSYGDLDDTKLIEGLTGEKSIYKRRGEKDPEMGSPQEKPKYVKILCDVSGSMYRFNGHDRRLDRELEAMVMVMEALEGNESKLVYDIIGHSGEGPHFNFVKKTNPPKNNKDRLEVIQMLSAHSQFCLTGDSTVEATRNAIKSLCDAEADEKFVIVLSDANFERYGIRPARFADVLTTNDDINAYVIFIGSLGDQAHRLMKQMPAGKAFLCMDTKNLPNILQQIFTSAMLKG